LGEAVINPAILALSSGLNNAKYYDCDIYFENLNGVQGEHMAVHGYGALYRDATVFRSASCSLRSNIFSLCSITRPVEVIKWTENNVPASVQARRVYIQGTGWSVVPTAAQLYLEAEYYDAAGAWTTTTIKSVNVLSGNGVWEPLTVSFVPGRVGPVTYRVVVAKYQAGGIIYLDHALYYSATEFLEAAFDWGKSVLPAFHNVLPVEHDVELGVSYGANGTEFTGTLAPILIGRDLEADVAGSAIAGEIAGFAVEGEVVMED
jgi:hypothetical protein